jgi:hypothetical protein
VVDRARVAAVQRIEKHESHRTPSRATAAKQQEVLGAAARSVDALVDGDEEVAICQLDDFRRD